MINASDIGLLILQLRKDMSPYVRCSMHLFQEKKVANLQLHNFKS